MDKSTIFYLVTKIFLYCMFASGLLFLFKDTVSQLILRAKMKNRLKHKRKSLRGDGTIKIHLDTLLFITLGKHVKSSTFLQCNTIFFLIVLILGLQSIRVDGAILMALCLSLLPYAILRLQLESKRRKGSHEGEKLISEFLAQYSMNRFNIYETIEKVIGEGRDIRVSKNLLFRLLLELRGTGNPAEIKLATDKFAYGIHTNWSRMLANSIALAAERGINVSSSIEDILIQLREARATLEERRRLNGESFRMVKILIPGMYVGTILFSTNYLDLSFRSFWKNQIYTSQGFILFFSILLMFGINLLVMELINNQKFDF